MAPAAVGAAGRAGGYELTAGQEALWFLQQLAPESSAYNVSGALNLHDRVDVELLGVAVEQVVSRHSMLNCRFRLCGPGVRRIPGAPGGAAVRLDVRDVAGDDREVEAVATGIARRPFRLDREPPVRVVLLRRDGAPDVLLVVVHHIVADQVSQLLVFREILDEYAARAAGGVHTPADTGACFAEFTRRQRSYLTSTRAGAARAHWRAELTDLPVSELPTDRPRPAGYEFAGAEIDLVVPSELLAEADTAAAAAGTTPFVVLHTVFQMLLHRFGGQTDFVVGHPATLRVSRRYQGAIGYFVNLLPYRARVEPGEPFGTVLRRTAEGTWRGQLHRELPYPLMPRLVDARPDPSRAGLVETMFAMTGSAAGDPLAALVLPDRRVAHAGLTISELYLPQQQGQLDLTLQVMRHGDAARAHLKYNTSLFTAGTAGGLAHEYLDLLRAATSGRL